MYAAYPSDFQLLTYCAHVLDNDETLAYYNIDPSCTLNVSDMRFSVCLHTVSNRLHPVSEYCTILDSRNGQSQSVRPHTRATAAAVPVFGPYALGTGRIGDYSIQNNSTIDVHIAHGLPIKNTGAHLNGYCCLYRRLRRPVWPCHWLCQDCVIMCSGNVAALPTTAVFLSYQSATSGWTGVARNSDQQY